MWKTFIFISVFSWITIKFSRKYAFITAFRRGAFLVNVDKTGFSTALFKKLWIKFLPFPQNSKFFKKITVFIQENGGKCG